MPSELREVFGEQFFKGSAASRRAIPTVDEPQIAEAVEPVPPFPKLPGALGQLVEAITHDISYDHKALAVVTYVGIGLTRRAVMIPEHWLQPRFYSCNIAAASGGKSAADAEVRRALFPKVLSDVKVELSIDSGPALVQALAENRRLILAPDELAEQFEKARAGSNGKNSLFGEFLRLYESNETANHTKKRDGEGGRVELHDAMFAMLGSATTERFSHIFIGTGATASGLKSRFTLAYSDNVMPRIKTANDEEAVLAAAQELRGIIYGEGDVELPARRFRLNEAAQEVLGDWRPFENDGREEMLRILDQAKRFALIVAACQKLSEIDGETMQLALQFADYQIFFRERLFEPDASSYVQAMENRIIAFLEKHSRATEALVQSQLKPDRLQGGYTAFNAAWAALIRAGKVLVVAKTHYSTPVYSLRSS